eukprot:TRINITY_DN10261_c0_g1_i1.p1 TRINITY_DN10261_c0_g1~~TRINITY_DN10261_c0_g1_i1.p1  ORF type:complete len:446 (-),score=114.27 TRINITY_DN10261_c0_g1_i1:174-1511(-)
MKNRKLQCQHPLSEGNHECPPRFHFLMIPSSNLKHQYEMNDDLPYIFFEDYIVDDWLRSIIEFIPSSHRFPLQHVNRRWNKNCNLLKDQRRNDEEDLSLSKRTDRIAFLRSVALEGRLNLLKWAYQNKCPLGESSYIMESAAKGGNLPTVMWLKEKGCQFNSQTCARAARSGRLDVLKWLKRQGCKWDQRTCSEAAKGGHLEVLKWAHSNGAPLGSETSIVAARGGHLECIKYTNQKGCYWNFQTSCAAAGNGHLELLKWISSKGCPWTQTTCTCAVWGGNLQVLIWLRENGCPWNEEVCEVAAKKGYLNILQWARKNGCPWDEAAYEAAAKHGNIEVMEWLKENNCPWDGLVPIIAAKEGRLDSLVWLMENGCPWGKDLKELASSMDESKEITQWLRKWTNINKPCENVENRSIRQKREISISKMETEENTVSKILGKIGSFFE